MGSFSWTRAERSTKRANLTDGDKYKILVPQEFGGGYITDIYWDYGELFHYAGGVYIDAKGIKYNNLPQNDLYGLLAYWNGANNLIYSSKQRPVATIDILMFGNTALQANRCAGIDIGCYNDQIAKLKYPLKLVSRSYKGNYESCAGRSYGDPNQGFGAYYWDSRDYAKYVQLL